MSKHALMISAALVGLMATGPAMAKGTLYPLPLVSGGVLTFAWGINDSNVVTGEWQDSSGNIHGFYGPDDGSDYTSFDDSGGSTEARGISVNGTITGYDTGTLVPWEMSTNGTLTDITRKGMDLNEIAQGINKSGIFAGNYDNTSGTSVGYLGSKAKYKSAFKLKGIKNTGYAGRGIDDAGDLVGWYLDSSGIEHGFLLSSGKVTTVDDPNGTEGTALEGINNKGTISGLYTDSSGNRHGFTYAIKSKKFTEITISGSAVVEAWGINDLGNVVLDDGTSQGYVYCPVAKNCPTEAAVKSPQRPVLQRPIKNLHPLLP